MLEMTAITALLFHSVFFLFIGLYIHLLKKWKKCFLKSLLTVCVHLCLYTSWMDTTEGILSPFPYQLPVCLPHLLEITEGVSRALLRVQELKWE